MAQTTQCGKIDPSKLIQIPNKKDVNKFDNGITNKKLNTVLAELNKGLIPKDGQQINTCPQSHYNNKYKSNYKEWIDSAINKFNSGVTTWANIKQKQDSNYATLVAKIQATNANIKNTNESKSLLDTSSNQNIINTNNASKTAWNTLQQSIADEKTAYARYNNHQQIYTTFKQEFTEEGGKFVSAYNAAVSKWETNHWKVNNNNLYTNIDNIEVTKDLITITLQNATTISHSTGYTGGDSWHIVMLNKDKDFSIVDFPMSNIYPSYNTNNNNNNCQWKDMYDDIQSICKKKNYENNIIILISPVNNNGMNLIKPSIETIGSITPLFFKKILEGCGYSKDGNTLEQVYDTIKDSNNNNIIVGTVTSITWPDSSTYIQTCSTSNTDKLLNNCIYNTSNICEKDKYFLTDNTCSDSVLPTCSENGYRTNLASNQCIYGSSNELCKTYYYDGKCNDNALSDCTNNNTPLTAQKCWDVGGGTKCDKTYYYNDECTNAILPTCQNHYTTKVDKGCLFTNSSNKQQETCNKYYYDDTCADKLPNCTSNMLLQVNKLDKVKGCVHGNNQKCSPLQYFYNGTCQNKPIESCSNNYRQTQLCQYSTSSFYFSQNKNVCDNKYYYDKKCNNTKLKACSTNETSTVGGSGCEYGNTQKCPANSYYYDNKCNSNKKLNSSKKLNLSTNKYCSYTIDESLKQTLLNKSNKNIRLRCGANGSDMGASKGYMQPNHHGWGWDIRNNTIELSDIKSTHNSSWNTACEHLQACTDKNPPKIYEHKGSANGFKYIGDLNRHSVKTYTENTISPSSYSILNYNTSEASCEPNFTKITTNEECKQAGNIFGYGDHYSGNWGHVTGGCSLINKISHWNTRNIPNKKNGAVQTICKKK